MHKKEVPVSIDFRFKILREICMHCKIQPCHQDVFLMMSTDTTKTTVTAITTTTTPLHNYCYQLCLTADYWNIILGL